MRPYLLAAKIAAVFLLVMGAFVTLMLHLFAQMVVHHRTGADLRAAHDTFALVFLLLALVAMVLMIAFSVYVTAPLRRMSRSMDRIAAGDLDHRITVRGNDEAAAMGRSFNAMAERVRGMVVGQKELMAGVSHELRSPLARMKLSVELMREGRAGSDRLEEIDSEIDTLDALVEELLLASRIELGSATLATEALDLEELCREAWARVAERAEAQNITLELDLRSDARTVQAERSLTLRLLGNLFENCVRHAGGGTVTVTARREAGRIRIGVADEGPGVDQADLDRLFEAFFRADRSRSRRTGAGGLGLMIVRRAVEAHGGEVEARRLHPRGLLVAFDLPAATV